MSNEFKTFVSSVVQKLKKKEYILKNSKLFNYFTASLNGSDSSNLTETKGGFCRENYLHLA